MARRGWRPPLIVLSLIALIFLLYLAGLGWGVPYLLKRKLGPRWHWMGYRFRLPGTVEIQQLIGPDSTVILRNLRLDFSPWDLPWRRFQALRIRFLQIQLPSGGTAPASKRSSAPGVPVPPALFERATIDTLRLLKQAWTVNLYALKMAAQGAPARFVYSLKIGRGQVLQGAQQIAGFSVALEGAYDHGSLLDQQVQIRGTPVNGRLWFTLQEHRLNLEVDSLAWQGRGCIHNLLAQVDLRVPGGEIRVARLRWHRQATGPWTLRFVWNAPRLELLNLEGTVGLLELRARGWWEPPQGRFAARIQAQGAWKGIDLERLVAEVSGTPHKGWVTVDLASLRWQHRRFQGIQARAAWQAPDRWVLYRLQIATPRVDLTGAGTRDSFALQAALQEVPLAYLTSRFPRGHLSLDLEVQGPYTSPRWRGTGQVAHAQVQKTVDLSFPFRIWGNPSTTYLKISRISGKLGHQPILTGTTSVALAPDHGQFSGTLTLADSSRLEATGEWAQNGGFTVILDSVVYRVPRFRNGLVLWANLQAEGPERDLFLYGHDLKGGTFLVTGVQQDTSFLVDASVENLALAPIPLPTRTNGRANLSLQMSGSLRAPHLALRARWWGDTLAGIPADSAELRVRLQKRLLVLSSLRIRQGERELRAYGEALMAPAFWLHRNFRPLHDSLSLYLWQWPLHPLLRSQPPGLYLDRLYASGELHVLGTLEAPLFRGSLTLTSPSAVLLASGTEVKDLRADLEFRPHRLEIQRFEARAPRGWVRGSGTTRLRGWSLDTVALDLSLRTFPLHPQPDVDLWVSGPLTVRGPFPHLHIDGNLSLDEGYITTPFGGSGEAEAGAPAPSPVTFRIRLRAPGQLFFINDVVQAELQADLTMEKDQPVGRYLSGHLQVLQGTLTYLDRTFRMEEGRMVFAHDPNFNPEIHFQALTTVQETILIRLLATGTLKEPRVQLTSDPVLPLEDIVSLLSFGFTLGQLAPNAATLAYLRTRSIDLAEALVSRELKRRLRLSELEIATGLAGRSPHFTVGFYLSPRVHIRYTHDLQSPSKDVFTLNYLLTRRLWLYVDRDRDSRLGVGLNWRYRF